MLLYDVNSSKNLIPFWKYDGFSLDNMEDEQCISEFRFVKEDLFLPHNLLQIPDRITCNNGTVVSGIEALFVYLPKKICLSVPISGHGTQVWKTNARALHNKQLQSELYT